MARPHIEPFVDRDVPFKKMTLPGFPKGMQYKMLSLDTDNGASSMTVLFEPGYKQPPGMSYTEYELFIMSGSVTIGEKVWGPGSYIFVPAGVALEPLSSPRGATGLIFYNYGEPSFVESDSDHPRPSATGSQPSTLTTTCTGRRPISSRRRRPVAWSRSCVSIRARTASRSCTA